MRIVQLVRLLREGERLIMSKRVADFATVREVIETGRQVTGKAITAIESPRRPGDPAELVASSARIERELGWTPQYGDLPTIMRTAYEWFENHPGGYSR